MPSLPPKCSYTTGLETFAWAAISSTEVPSKPFSAKSARPISLSCSRRCAPVTRRRDLADSLTGSLMTPALPGLGGPCHGRAGVGTGLGRPPYGAGRPHRSRAARSGDALRGDARRIGPVYVVGPAQLLERPDQPGAQVDLALEHAVPGRDRVRVVEVVPGLTERG